MGTSASGTGPKGKTPLLPSWAIESDPSIGQNQDIKDQNSNDDSSNATNTEGDTSNSDDNAAEPVKNNGYSNDLRGAKSSLKRVANGNNGSSIKKAAKSYVRSTGGAVSASKASLPGISVGGGYLDFWGGVSKQGFKETLAKYDLEDCVGKSTEEVFARIADKIAPIGSTNDDAIARAAVMMAFEKLCDHMIENGQDLDALDKLDESVLHETVTEFVSAYIFKKWVYEAGLALERNELSEQEAIDLENEMRIFVRGEVKNSLRKTNVLKLDLANGDGKEIVKRIFDLAYSTLEK